MVRHAKVTRDEVLNHRCVPASRGLSRLLWARFAPLGELWALGCGACAGAPWRSLVSQAGQALEEILLAVSTHGLLTEREPLSHGADAWALSQGQEGMEALNQCQRTAGIGLLETTRELRAGEGHQVVGKRHEGILLRRTMTNDDPLGMPYPSVIVQSILLCLQPHESFSDCLYIQKSVHASNHTRRTPRSAMEKARFHRISW